MNKKLFLALTMIIITALALTVFNLKLFPAQAQSSNPAYQLTITGLVQNPLNLTLADIKAMPQTTEYAALICVDAPNTPLLQGYWTGVELSYLLQQANVSLSAVKVAFFAPDGFTTDLTVQTAAQGNSILVAYQLDNASLSGLRLVVPDNWGYKWISDLTQIKLVNYNFLGTEESEGCPDDATIPSGSTMPNVNVPNVPFSSPNNATTTQNSTPTPTLLPQSPTPTANPTSTAASNSKPQSTSALLVYIATASAIILVFAVVSVATLIKRKKTKTMKRELENFTGRSNGLFGAPF
jgi:type 1 fimbria pilin